MNSLDNGLKRLRNQVPESNTASLYNTILHKALQPQASVIQFDQLKKVAVAAATLVLINISVIFWSLHKNKAEVPAAPGNAYLQSFNLSIY